jgi:hypothetical protein
MNFFRRLCIDYQFVVVVNLSAVKIMLSRCIMIYFFFLTCGCQPKSKSDLLYEKDLSARQEACDLAVNPQQDICHDSNQ